MNIKRIYFTAIALGAAAVAFGQNLNPTVEVTKTYEGDPSSVQKPMAAMNVPDSLMRFDLDFDYEVFDNPYQAAYDFKPYMLNIKPDKDAFRGKSLYFKAGAGYSLRPQVDFVWSPNRKSPFQFSIYAHHRSYFGKYHEITPQLNTEANQYKLKSNGSSYSGHDALTTAGFDGRYSWNTGTFTFGAGYYGLHTKDTLLSRGYNAVDVYLALRSYETHEAHFHYDIALNGRFGKDNLNYLPGFGRLGNTDFLDVMNAQGISEGKTSYNESLFSLNGNFGFAVKGHEILIGMDAIYASYSDLLQSAYGMIAITPKYVFEKGKVKFDVGIRLQQMMHSDDNPGLLRPEIWEDGFSLGPDVSASIALAKWFQPYAGFIMGTDVNTMSSVLAVNHHANPLYSHNGSLFYSDAGWKADIGFKGNISSGFHYDLNVGAASSREALMDGMAYPGNSFYMPCYTWGAYNLLFANALLSLHAKRFKADLDFHYVKTTFHEDTSRGLPLPDFTAGLKAVYDITSRIYLGVDMSLVSKREGYAEALPGIIGYSVPGWFDLGVLGGYQFNRKLGFWIESGNLLCQEIQMNPFYAEKGLWVTAGITLNL